MFRYMFNWTYTLFMVILYHVYTVKNDNVERDLLE